MISERKVRKIRPGFTPEEDVAKYKSSGRRETERLQGYVPGASSVSSATYLSDFPVISGGAGSGGGMSKAAKKNFARKEKRAAEKEAKEWDSDDWDADDDVKAGPAEPATATTASAASNGYAMKEAETEIVAGMEKITVEQQGGSTSTSASPSPSPSLSSSTSTAATKNTTPRPGGGLFRDLPLKKPSSSSLNNPPSTASSRSIPGASSSSNGAPPAQRPPPAARERKEVKVRPNQAGLGMLRNIVSTQTAENEKMSSGRR